jgi:hypothetical protein
LLSARGSATCTWLRPISMTYEPLIKRSSCISHN